MTLYLKQTLPDGATVIADNDGAEWVLRPGQWEQVQAIRHDQQREYVERLVAGNAADPTGGRSELDEAAIQMNEQGQGERHEQSEESGR